jgi:uncharacterized protein (TIGR02687 family)
MNIEKIINQLQYLSKSNRVIFWQDHGYFAPMLKEIELALPELKLINAEIMPDLQIKVMVDLECKDDKFIVYRTSEPNPADDWLLNIKCYAVPFRADPYAITLQELGLTDYKLVSWVEKHFKFFNSKERKDRFIRLISDNDSENELTDKLIATTIKINESGHEAILIKILIAYVNDKLEDVMNDINSYNLTEGFWRLLINNYSANAKDQQLIEFIKSLFVTDLYAGFSDKKLFPQQLRHYVLEPRINNVTTLFSYLRDSQSFKEYYFKLAKDIAIQLNIKQVLADLEINCIENSNTFIEIESQISQTITQNIGNANQDNLEYYQKIIVKRNLLFWATADETIKVIYLGLSAAIKYLYLIKQYPKINYSEPNECFSDYIKHSYMFDRNYRKFITALRQTSSTQLTYLAESFIEPHYVNCYLQELSASWDKILNNGFLEKWQLPKITNQYNFYRKYLRSRVEEQQFKTVVIISDGMRYEVAQELQELFSVTNNYESQITPMLGVLPSYTQLGMAALLPNNGLEYRKDLVYIDGKITNGISNRGAILAQVSGQAIDFVGFSAKTTNERKEYLNQKVLTYIYHDVIDATGDKLKTEHKTSNACDDTVKELADLIRGLATSCDCSRIIVTSDHGFTYQNSPITAADINRIELKDNCIYDHKRFKIISGNIEDNNFPLNASLIKTSGVINSDYRAIMANRHGRFNLSGGAQYTHGGASLQEITVPVVEINYNSCKVQNKISLVAAKFNLSNNFKVTSYNFNVEIYQYEPLSPCVLADEVSIVVCDEVNNIVSDIKKIALDSNSSEVEHRTFKVNLALKQSISYTRGEKYRLEMRGKQQVKDSQLIKIDILGFDNDF